LGIDVARRREGLIKVILLGIGMLALAVVGASLQNIWCLYVLILLVCVTIALVTFDKLEEAYYPGLLFIIGLSLLWQTTLMGPGLVGSDIHIEYYFHLKSISSGWDYTYPHTYNSCIGATIIAPFLSRMLGISGIWVFKAIYPFLFSFVPLLLYYIYRKQVGNKLAFLAVFFLITVPTWSLEMIGLPRQMLGELMLVACLYLVVVSSWPLKAKVPLIISCSILGVMFHYIIGPAIWLYLGLGMVALLFFKRRTFPVKWLVVIVLILSLACLGWYGGVSSGIPLEVLSREIPTLIAKTLPAIPGTSIEPSDTPVGPPAPEEPNLLEKQEPLVRTAFGLDFMDVSLLGKVFRVFQFITQLLLVVGCFYLLWYRKRYTPEYLSFAGVSVILLLACIVIPRFSNMINATRFYHIALLLLAPAVILGGKLIFRDLRVLVLCLLIPYFLFTSGMVFEAFQYKDIAKIDIPYSIALSHERVDVAAVFTINDIKVRDWAVEHKYEPIFSDINGMLLLSEKMDPSTHKDIGADVSEMKSGWAFLPRNSSELPRVAYIFLRERSVQTKTVTSKPDWFDLTKDATGTRQSYSFEELGLTGKGEVVYQSGDAVLLVVRDGN